MLFSDVNINISGSYIDLDNGIQGLNQLVGMALENIANLSKMITIQNRLTCSRLSSLEALVLNQDLKLSRMSNDLRIAQAATLKCQLEMKKMLGKMANFQANSVVMFAEHRGQHISREEILDGVFRGKESSIVASTARGAADDAEAEETGMVPESTLMEELAFRLNELSVQDFDPKSKEAPEEMGKEDRNYAKVLRQLQKRRTAPKDDSGNFVYFPENEIHRQVEENKTRRFPNTRAQRTTVTMFSTDQEIADARDEAELLRVPVEKRIQRERRKKVPADAGKEYNPDATGIEFTKNFQSPPKKAKKSPITEPPKSKHINSIAGVELSGDDDSDVDVEDAAPVASGSLAAFSRTAMVATAITPSSPKASTSAMASTPSYPKASTSAMASTPSSPRASTSAMASTSTPSVPKRPRKLDSKGRPLQTARKSTTPQKVPRNRDDSVVETSVVEPSSPSPSPFVFIPNDDRHPLAPHVPTQPVDPEGLEIKEELVTLNERVKEARRRKYSGNNED